MTATRLPARRPRSCRAARGPWRRRTATLRAAEQDRIERRISASETATIRGAATADVERLRIDAGRPFRRSAPKPASVLAMDRALGVGEAKHAGQILPVYRGRRGEPDLNGQPDLAAVASGSGLGRGSASVGGWRSAYPLLAFAHDRVAQGSDAGDVDVGRVAMLDVFGSAFGDPILTTSPGQRVKYRLRWERGGENEFKVSSNSPLEENGFELQVPRAVEERCRNDKLRLSSEGAMVGVGRPFNY